MSPLAKKLEKKYTYQDYLSWNEGRWEIIDGQVYDMSPAPNIRHQKVSGNLFFELKKELRNKNIKCDIFDAPTDVVLDDFNVVQPDIFIVCDKGKITDKNIQGAPDLVIEIVSKSTAYKDTKIKKDLYESFGVKEYILVFPELEIVERYTLENGKYGIPERFNWDEIFKLKTFDIELPLWEIFEKERPNESSSQESSEDST